MDIKTEERARIARDVDAMAKHFGINEPCNINALIRWTILKVEIGLSTDKALVEIELLAKKIMS
ncbi:MAG: hypothetical protein Q8Q40_14155 [Methylococcaceae bacterium]|nr:hypothetical protein [Methylococcaceae bacterium]MDP3905100.1 hypothetical protein [Methylococcaceae bacterium]